MNSVFGSLHHLWMRLQPDKNQKNRREKVFRFYCWQHISVHISGHGCDKWIPSSVVCIIYRCAYSQIKIRKNRRQKVFRFYCWQHISVHISGHGCDKWIRSSVVCIIYGCAYSQIKIRKIGEKKFSVFTAGSLFRSISRVMGVINKFGLR